MTDYPGPTAIRPRTVHDAPWIYNNDDLTNITDALEESIAYRRRMRLGVNTRYMQRQRGHNTRAAFRHAVVRHPVEAAVDRVLTRLRIWMRKGIKRVRQAARIPVALTYGVAEGHGYGNENSGHKLLRYLPFV